MEGEEERSENEGSFSKSSIPKRIAIVAAGATVNIIFGIVIYFILTSTSPAYYLDISFKETENNLTNHLIYAGRTTKELIISIAESIKMIFTGGISADQMMGPVGISGVVSKTSGIREFLYMLALISVSLGVTNLLPIPALDGGKILLLIIEAIRRKPLNEKTEINIQLIGFSILIALSLYITYNDILRIF